MSDLNCSFEDLVTVEQFSSMFNVRSAWVIARIKDKSLNGVRMGHMWLLDVSSMRGYVLLTDYAEKEELNADSLRKRLSKGWLLGKKIGAYWFVNPDCLRFVPEGYIPVKEYAERVGMRYQTAIDNCRYGKVAAIKHGKYWFVKDDIPTQLCIEQ